MYESICCPRDYKHDTHLINYIKNFETKNDVILKSNFKLQLGREGEAAYFLSLENLSVSLQEAFVNNRLQEINPDDTSIKNQLANPISIKECLKRWDNLTINNLTKL